MGNRGTVVFTDGNGRYSCAVYLHWNGSAESVYPFLEELDRRKARNDQDYEVARFVQLVGDFFDSDEIGSTSLGLVNGPKSDALTDLDQIETDHGDNGLFLVRRTGEKTIVRRFTEKYDKNHNGRFEEWSLAKVDSERENAAKHEYAAGIRETFQKIQGKRKISEY